MGTHWNSLYLEAAADPPGEIVSGSTLRGRFKGSGPASVTFVDVVKDQHFTHHTLMKGPYTAITLGRFDHTHSVAARIFRVGLQFAGGQLKVPLCSCRADA